jgi:hypothetical protein
MRSLLINRRTFLQGTSGAALSTLLPSLAAATSSPTAEPKRAAASLPSASGFNRGRSQVNLNFLQIGGDYPFLNCMKNAQRWEYLDNSGPPEPSELDSNGYPMKISHSGVYSVFFVPPQTARPGNYVVTWDGNGTIFCGMPNNPVSGSKTSSNGRGRYVFFTTDNRFSIGIVAIRTPRITNLRVFHVDDEAALNAVEVFGVQFKQRLTEANFGVIRFLNWQAGNSTNVTTWATRKPISYVFYTGEEYRGSLYAGLTTKAGSAYSANLPGFTLTDKATVMVKFNASNNGPCTLNVSETADINILDALCTPLSAAGNNYPVGGTWQSIATLVYDATLNAWIKQGGDIALGSMGLASGCPPELMVRLCAEVGAHPYFVTPSLAIDPATDYMPSLAAYCLANGPDWMIARFEGPNELWNPGENTGFANAKATAYGWGADYHNWYGKVMSVLGQAISNVYGGNRSKYQVLAGVQTATGIASGETAASDARLASNKYLAQSAPPQGPYTKTPASQWVTHVCCAQYYGPADYGTPKEQAYADVYAAAEGNPTKQMEIATAYANTVNSGSGRYTIPKLAIAYRNWKVWALKFQIKKMCGYEGGYSPDYDDRGTSKVDKLRGTSKQAASLYDFTMLNYNNFVGLSDTKFIAEFPSCFQLSGSLPSNNAWAVLEDIYQQPNPPQWRAIVAFNH